MADLIENGGYRFWSESFSLQSAYEDCKAVFNGITDDDSFQKCDFGMILDHAHEIIYALKTCMPSAQSEKRTEERTETHGVCLDTISRQALCEYALNQKDKSVTPNDIMRFPSAQPEHRDALEKAVAVEAISDELMSRFDISATYAYDVAESAVNRIEVMAKKMYRGEDG